jgi:hypothetical protein
MQVAFLCDGSLILAFVSKLTDDRMVSLDLACARSARTPGINFDVALVEWSSRTAY